MNKLFLTFFLSTSLYSSVIIEVTFNQKTYYLKHCNEYKTMSQKLIAIKYNDVIYTNSFLHPELNSVYCAPTKTDEFILLSPKPEETIEILKENPIIPEAKPTKSTDI